MKGAFNMKRTSIATEALLFLLLFVAGTAKAQDYLPLVKDNAEWNVMWQSTSSWPTIRITESLSIDGDTLVNDMHYKKVMRLLSSEGPYWPGNIVEHELYGLIREEPEGKVFYQPIDQDTIYLLYDFSMNVNDTVVMSWCQEPHPLWDVTIRIDSITTQYIAGMNRRVFYVSSKDAYSDWTWLNTWVEGIGATEGLLYSCHVVSAGGITLHKLLCYHEDDELLYMNPEYDTCVVDMNPLPQDFAPLGAEWYFHMESQGPITDPPFYYIRMSVTGLAEIQGHVCSKIDLHDYVYEENRVVYWYNQTNDAFTVLYDFNAEEGDTWYCDVGECTFLVTVQSVDSVTWNGHTYRTQYVTAYSDDGQTPAFNGRIFEKIGYEFGLFPDRFACDGIDGPDYLYMRCYVENGEILYHEGDYDCDYVVPNGIDENDTAKGSLVYPNPISESGTLNFEQLNADELTIITVDGRIVRKENVKGLSSFNIEKRDLDAGLYFYMLSGENMKTVVGKMCIK